MQRAHLFVVPVVMNSAARRLEHEPEGLHRGYQRRPTGAGGPSRSYPDAMATPRSTSSTARRLVAGFAHAEVLEMVDLALYFGAPAQKCLGPGFSLGGPGGLDAAVVAAHHDGAPAFPGGAAVPERASSKNSRVRP